VLILVTSFGILTALVFNGGIADFESSVYAAIIKYRSSALTEIMITVTNMGSAFVIIAVTGIFLALPFTRMKFGIPIAINTAMSAGLNVILKIAIARDRPDILRLVGAAGYGFPSGHAMNNAALYALLALIVFRWTENNKIRLSILLFSITVTAFIGVSRIYLGVHNAGDVLAGWIMGMAVALFTDIMWRLIQDTHQKAYSFDQNKERRK